MTARLRLALTIFSIGFLVEGLGDLYAFVTRAAVLPGGSFLVYFAPAFTLVGLLSLWLGRHEWNEAHAGRVRHAHLAFGVAVALAAVAAVPLVAADLLGTSVGGSYSPLVFSAAVAGLLWFGYLTYALAAGHLAGPVGRVLVVLALAWAAFVAFLLAGVAQDLFPRLVQAVTGRTVTTPGLIDPFTAQLSILFVTYLLLFGAFVDAHRRVVRGDAAGGRAPPAATPTAPRSAP